MRVGIAYRRLIACVLVAILGAGVAGARGEVPGGPRLAVVKFGTRPPRLELLTVDARGALPVRLAGGGEAARLFPFPLATLSWSPDGGTIAFTGWIGARREGGPQTKLFLVAADGSGLRAVPDTLDGYGPVFSSDGHTLAFTRFREAGRFSGASAWSVDLASGEMRQLTPWRNCLENLPSSYSPDGAVLAMSRDRPGRGDPEAVALRLDGSGTAVLARHAIMPVYSPDGSQIAFARLLQRRFETTTDLFAMAADGSQPRRLTRTPMKTELWPSWDPSGERIAYAQFRPESAVEDRGRGDAVMQVNADGSCRRKLLSVPGASFYAPAWQPGPGREAGRIVCGS
jgi:Tol biopolymer transport system component